MKSRPPGGHQVGEGWNLGWDWVRILEPGALQVGWAELPLCLPGTLLGMMDVGIQDTQRQQKDEKGCWKRV